MALKVAVVGAGAAGMYAIHHLLEQAEFDVEIDLFERLPTPWGLIRAGVAPDHPEKKQIIDRLFQFYLKHPNVRFFGNVEIGSAVTHDELKAFYDAIIYAVGAEGDKSLGIAGEQLPGSWSARQFVAWYNGHPDYSGFQFDLSHSRAVIVGTGNVALDVARILALRPDDLAKTDIADHALAELRRSRVTEVMVLGRRGCANAAFHNPELEELLRLGGVEVRIEGDDPTAPKYAACDWETARKLATLARLQAQNPAAPAKRILFRFHQAPVAVIGEDRVRGLRTQTPDGGPSDIACGLLVRAIGYRGQAVAGLPFDPRAGVISNLGGRVVDGDRPQVGAYVTGWIKRGPRGVIGSNKRCAGETVAHLLEDARAGRLAVRNEGDVEQLLAARHAMVVSQQGWRRIDAAERRAGWLQRRPRIKQTNVGELLGLAGVGD